MYSDKAESFAKFLAYAEQYIAANLNNFVKIKLHKATSYFQAAFFLHQQALDKVVNRCGRSLELTKLIQALGFE